MSRIHDFIELARPWQWSKNGVVMAGVIFSGHLNEPSFLLRGLLALASFCLVSGAIYTTNDMLDVRQDRMHPDKKTRPLAAGRVATVPAGVFAFILLALGSVLAMRLGAGFLGWLGAFLGVNLMYSTWTKRFVILDVLSIAVSFVIRAIGGVAAVWALDPTVAISRWLLVCTFFLALFLALGKRRSELALLEAQASEHRRSLGEYSVPFLDHLMSIVTGAVVLAYAIYTVEQNVHTDTLVYTLPLVVYGVFYYLHVTQHLRGGGNPSRLLYRDPHIMITVILWILAVVYLLYRSQAA